MGGFRRTGLQPALCRLPLLPQRQFSPCLMQDKELCAPELMLFGTYREGDRAMNISRRIALLGVAGAAGAAGLAAVSFPYVRV
jgi:hypothetical protein